LGAIDDRSKRLPVTAEHGIDQGAVIHAGIVPCSDGHRRERSVVVRRLGRLRGLECVVVVLAVAVARPTLVVVFVVVCLW
jgi:hypothetical protein